MTTIYLGLLIMQIEDFHVKSLKVKGRWRVKATCLRSMKMTDTWRQLNVVTSSDIRFDNIPMHVHRAKILHRTHHGESLSKLPKESRG